MDHSDKIEKLSLREDMFFHLCRGVRKKWIVLILFGKLDIYSLVQVEFYHSTLISGKGTNPPYGEAVMSPNGSLLDTRCLWAMMGQIKW
ncbi:hypothetical protein KTT_48430 [Tengunoibacter tsumagoiensis]|uniref:Uncharacterized protein n=1 Tax=Tengunoibacter tsumagoiensis TaxID=2014871 RepID=A0A402A771_9CHLR|nr:hypothetical protein KTT_48430 [Tengunoibacter tsumagoiensis]